MKKYQLSRMIGCLALGVIWGLSGNRCAADEGMFPISEIQNLQLQELGFKLPANEIFNPDGVSLIDGICRVNGCTGSFVSPQGLIITNHHCAYRAIQTASTVEHDYLTDGFLAKTKELEIPAPGYTVRITESYVDVSPQVLEVVTADMPFLERTKSIDRRRKELEQTAEQQNPGLRAEVAEMFTGKTYVLFLYTYLKDVRLVFAPPSAIGNFGGEVDNWEWPRHTGDFSLMRAYTSVDGKSADYDPNNIPYQPKRVISVDPKGVDEGDLVFLLGYPGRTVRHKTASFLAFDAEYRLPMTVDLYQWQIREMETAGQGNRAIALKHASRIKSLANVEKRTRGQLKGLQRTDILERRRAEERAIESYLQSQPNLAERYGATLADIDQVYQSMSETATFEIHFNELRNASRMLATAWQLWDLAVERQKPDLDRETAALERNLPQTIQQLVLAVKDIDRPTDQLMLQGMIQRLSQIEQSQQIPALWQEIKKLQNQPELVADWISSSKLADVEFVERCLKMSPSELAAVQDPLLQWMGNLYPAYIAQRELDKQREGQLNRLYGDWQSLKEQYLATAFVPDANATLRMTFGRVRGYSPADALTKQPISTLRGMLEKETGTDPFIVPEVVKQAHARGNFGDFVHPRLNQVPIAILYSADTTGGNSGSPILNASGQLIGVNFDRTFEATINDFAWNENYSRSIGVDIRFVLWITGTVYGGDHLLQEMGVK